MDFVDAIKAHAKRVMERKDMTATEQAAKMALIVPFFQVLGYDPYDPNVVIPEYCADFGEKRECKVDYAIKRGNDIVIIVEAKKVGDSLDGSKEGQLQQYFQSLLPVKIAILTDGVRYKFFTDLDNPNVMDNRPFMTFDFSAMDEGLIPELKKLCNDCFDLDTALRSAQELKYLGQLKKIVATEMEEPSEGLIKHFAWQVYEGKLTGNVVEAFKERVKSAFKNHINDVLNARLQGAMQPANAYPIEPTAKGGQDEGGNPLNVLGNAQGDGIETTHLEVEGFYIVRAIISSMADSGRIIARDTMSYCGVLFDDNNRKPICRLRFNNPARLVCETFDVERKTSFLHKLEKVSDIYNLADTLRATVGHYIKGKDTDADKA